MKKPEAEELLPLSQPVFHILVSLAREDRHGYGIMLDIAEQTNGALEMGPGTLYGCLKRMLASGLVEEGDERPDPENGRPASPLLSDDGLRPPRGSRGSGAPANC